MQWNLAGGLPPTNYRDVVASMLDETHSASWLVDASAHASIFRSAAFGGGATPIYSLAQSYFERAAGYGDAQSDRSACIAWVALIESNQATVARACAPGAVALVTGRSIRTTRVVHRGIVLG